MDAPDPFHVLKQALQARLDVVADRELYARDPQEHLRQLQARSAELEQAAAALPASAPPQLLHFLKNGSYLKAVNYLDQIQVDK